MIGFTANKMPECSTPVLVKTNNQPSFGKFKFFIPMPNGTELMYDLVQNDSSEELPNYFEPHSRFDWEVWGKN